MPIAELLGVQFDMHLLGKLALSAASVLFVSLVFRFYNSRERNRRQGNESVSGQRGGQATQENGTCFLDQQVQDTSASDRENRLHQTLKKPLLECLKTGYSTLGSNQPETSMVDNLKEEAAWDNVPTEDTIEAKCGELSENMKITLQPAYQRLPSGRQSPCLVKTLDGATGIGRELRQDLGHQGMFSSFQSKAEIKVENTSLILSGARNNKTGVHGKIYDYFVESSSHSFADLRPMTVNAFGQKEGGTLSRSPSQEFLNVKKRARSPSPQPSRFIMGDVEMTSRVRNQAIEPQRDGRSRQVIIRQDSYRSAAIDSELPIPLCTPSVNPPDLSSKQPNDISSSLQDSATDSPAEPEEPQVETRAGAKFLHLSHNMEKSQLESLAGKLDLGNCLEALTLAKKHGHTVLQQAALRVMSDNYLQVLRDPSLFGRLKAGERDHIQTQRVRGRKWLVVADMECPDWSRCPSHSANSESESVKPSTGMYYYDDYKDTWHLHCHIPQEVLSKGCAMCTMDNYLFITVGFQGADREVTPSKRVYCYNPMTSIWSEISPMNEARPHCKLVALQGYLYAIGGECLSTVERYDPRKNKWTFVAPLPNETFAVAHRATACNDELFVAGGTLRYTLLRYNPKADLWRESMIVGSKDRTKEMVAVRNFLYRFDVNALGISVYRYHAVARMWYECSSIRLPHCCAFQCVTMDNIIYCVSRQFTLRFLADEVSPSFVAQDLKALSPAKGILFPFVLVLPEKTTLQTRV